MASMNPTSEDLGKVYKSRIELTQDQKNELILLLNHQLANSFDLMSQTKHAHWNVKGANFYGLHKMFDDLHEVVEENVDTIAERITALGGLAHGTTRMAAAATELDEFPVDLTASLDVVSHMARVYSQCANTARHGIDRAEELGDMATSDMLTDVVRDLDKAIYFLESHLQK